MASEYSGSGDPRRTIELLWGVRADDRPRRGPKPRHTLDDVVAAAVSIADRDGLAGLSMRRVAEDLGLTAMSLYGYVPSKAELLDVMTDRVHGELPAGDALPDDGWRARLAAAARETWAMYRRHPWLLGIATSRPLLGPNLIAKYDTELAAVDGLGLSDVEMDLVVSFVGDYVRGAARTAVEAAQAGERSGLTEGQWWETFGPLLGEVLDPARFPTASRVGAAAGAEYGAAYDPERAFAFGLERVLDGVETLVTAAAAAGDR